MRLAKGEGVCVVSQSVAHAGISFPGEGRRPSQVFVMKTCDQICNEQYECERRHKWNALARSLCDKATGCRC